MSFAKAVSFLKRSDPVLAGVIARIGDCQLWQDRTDGDLFSALARSILHQQLSGKAAATIHGRFLQLYPDKPHPAADDILATPDEVLRGVGISRPKIGYLKDLAQKTSKGLPTLAELEEMEDEAIVQTLTQVKGVGRWTVQMLLIFRMQRHDVMPVDDLGIRTGIKKVYALAELPDKKTIAHLAQKWTPYCSIASWYLWQSLKIDG